MKRFYAAILAFILFSSTTAPDEIIPDRTENKFIYDEANVLAPEDKEYVNQACQQVFHETKATLMVLIVNSLKGNTIEEVGIQAAEKWKPGDEKRDNGVIVILAIEDRKSRIEVGQGLEGTLTDVHSKIILTEIMRPYLQSNSISKAVLSGITEIKKVISGTSQLDSSYDFEEYEVNGDLTAEEWVNLLIAAAVVILLTIFVTLPILKWLIRVTKYRLVSIPFMLLICGLFFYAFASISTRGIDLLLPDFSEMANLFMFVSLFFQWVILAFNYKPDGTWTGGSGGNSGTSGSISGSSSSGSSSSGSSSSGSFGGSFSGGGASDDW